MKQSSTFRTALLVLTAISSPFYGAGPSSPTDSGELGRQINELNPDAITEAGNRKETSLAPILRQIADAPEVPDNIRQAHKRKDPTQDAAARSADDIRFPIARKAARIALAKQGESKYLLFYVSNLKSKNGSERVEAINALSSIGDKRTAQFLIPILDDHGFPPRVGKHGMPVSFSDMAEQALHRMFPDVVQQFRKQNPKKRFSHHAEWKEWWKSARRDLEVKIE